LVVCTVDIEFVGIEVAISFAVSIGQIERFEYRSIEALARFEIFDAEMNMIEQAPLTVNHDVSTKRFDLSGAPKARSLEARVNHHWT